MKNSQKNNKKNKKVNKKLISLLNKKENTQNVN